MVPFFVGMALFCGSMAWRLGSRSLAVCGVLFMGLAGMPLIAPQWLVGYGMAIIGLAGGVQYAFRHLPCATPPTRPVHHAVCRPYHSTVAFEDRE